MRLVDPPITLNARCKSTVVVSIALLEIVSDRGADTTRDLGTCRAIKKCGLLIADLAIESGKLGSQFFNFLLAEHSAVALCNEEACDEPGG